MRSLIRLLAILACIFVACGPAVCEDILNKPAPPLILPDINNNNIDLASYKGKVVYVDFWASWCAPCQASFPWMEELYSKHKANGLEIIAVNVDTENKDALKFLNKMKPTFTVVFDPKGETPEKWAVSSMPHSFLIDKNGTIVRSFKGFRDSEREEIEKAISSIQ